MRSHSNLDLYLAAHNYTYRHWGRGEAMISVRERFEMLARDINRVYPGADGEQIPPVPWIHRHNPPGNPINFFGAHPVIGVNIEGLGYGDPLLPADPHEHENIDAVIEAVAHWDEDDE